MVNKEFFLALDELVEKKGIKKEVMLETLKTAMATAYKKQTGDVTPIEMEINEEKHTIKFFSIRTVVDVVNDYDNEVSLEEAREAKKTYKIGDIARIEFLPKNFGRIATQAAKQVILQKIRESEVDMTVSEFEDKEGEMQMCMISRIENKNVYVEIGSGEVSALMLPFDQIPTEQYNVGDKMYVYVKKVKSLGKNAQILVSRTSKELVKRLFEREVSEIRDGTVVIKSIAREPGQRTKIAITSTNPNIDPVGACVGNKGSRVNAVVNELNGEKIDIIVWSENPLEYIQKALSPAKVLSVTGNEVEKKAMVVVPDNMLSLAIGKDGQNARLAAKLTDWKIDVKSETKAKELFGDMDAEILDDEETTF